MKDNRKNSHEFVEVFSSSYEDQIAFVKSILNANSIVYIVQGDSHAYIPGAVISTRIFVKNCDAENAKSLLKKLT